MHMQGHLQYSVLIIYLVHSLHEIFTNDFKTKDLPKTVGFYLEPYSSLFYLELIYLL